MTCVSRTASDTFLFSASCKGCVAARSRAWQERQSARGEVHRALPRAERGGLRALSSGARPRGRCRARVAGPCRKRCETLPSIFAPRSHCIQCASSPFWLSAASNFHVNFQVYSRGLIPHVWCPYFFLLLRDARCWVTTILTHNINLSQCYFSHGDEY